ncbi:MAG: DUF3343 domain-containing protein [Clostridia bacterium]|nr:DUF3343 domain-containing protein [Clostridia bacterium]
MSESIITMRSETYAAKASKLLTRYGLRCRIVSVDPALTSRGCSVGVAVNYYDVKEVKRLLNGANITFGEVLGQREF